MEGACYSFVIWRLEIMRIDESEFSLLAGRRLLGIYWSMEWSTNSVHCVMFIQV